MELILSILKNALTRFWVGLREQKEAGSPWAAVIDNQAAESGLRPLHQPFVQNLVLALVTFDLSQLVWIHKIESCCWVFCKRPAGSLQFFLPQVKKTVGVPNINQIIEGLFHRGFALGFNNYGFVNGTWKRYGKTQR